MKEESTRRSATKVELSKSDQNYLKEYKDNVKKTKKERKVLNRRLIDLKEKEKDFRREQKHNSESAKIFANSSLFNIINGAHADGSAFLAVENKVTSLALVVPEEDPQDDDYSGVIFSYSWNYTSRVVYTREPDHSGGEISISVTEPVNTSPNILIPKSRNKDNNVITLTYTDAVTMLENRLGNLPMDEFTNRNDEVDLIAMLKDITGTCDTMLIPVLAFHISLIHDPSECEKYVHPLLIKFKPM